MLIDRTHRGWIVGCLIALLIATAIYIPYARASLHGPTGGSVLGLTYGILGFALMIFAGLLGARRKVPMWRLGRAATWMRGHIWLGLLSFPLILFHGDNRALDLSAMVFGAGLGMALDEWVYLIATDGTNASYMLPVSLWGGVIVILLTCLYVIGLMVLRRHQP